MGGAHLDEVAVARRLRLARAILEDGGNLTTLARRCGVSLKSAHLFLKRHDPGLLRNIATGPRGRALSAHQALVRLLLLKSVEGFVGGERKLANALGLTREALYAFRRKWAPDGLDAAIADLLPEDGEAAHG